MKCAMHYACRLCVKINWKKNDKVKVILLLQQYLIKTQTYRLNNLTRQSHNFHNYGDNTSA